MAGILLESLLEERVDVKYSCIKHDVFRVEGIDCADPPFKFYTSHPEKNVEDMVVSKDITKNCRVPYIEPLLNARVQLESEKVKLFHNERRLVAARRKLDQKRHLLIEQWNVLARKEEELRENFLHFNKFVIDNKEKKIRAVKKLEDDKNQKTNIQKDIDSLQEVLDETMKTTKEMDQKSQKYSIYTDYLRDVVETNPQFTTISSLIDRYNDLDMCKDWLLQHQKSLLTFLEIAHSDMMKLIEEKNFVIMGLNNQIANLQARYENANIKALESEELVTEIKNNAVKQLSELDMVKNSVWNVYVHMATSKKHPIKIKKDNVEEQMMYINRTLTELSKVNKIIKKKSNKMK